MLCISQSGFIFFLHTYSCNYRIYWTIYLLPIDMQHSSCHRSSLHIYIRLWVGFLSYSNGPCLSLQEYSNTTLLHYDNPIKTFISTRQGIPISNFGSGGDNSPTKTQEETSWAQRYMEKWHLLLDLHQGFEGHGRKHLGDVWGRHMERLNMVAVTQICTLILLSLS